MCVCVCDRETGKDGVAPARKLFLLEDFGFRVSGSSLRVQGLGFRVWG